MKTPLILSAAALMLLAAGIAGCSQAVNSDTTDTAKLVSDAKGEKVAAGSEAKIGAPAPTFELRDQNDKVHSLADYKGKTVVLAFYPADMTPGCTLEAHNLTKALPQFEKRGATIIGVSVQDVASKKKFCDKEGIKYTMLADTEKKASQAYGVLLGGKVAKRASFMIAPDGTLAAEERDIKPAQVVEQTMALLDKAAAQQKSAKSMAARGGNGGATIHTIADTGDDKAAKVAIDQPVAPFSLPNYDDTKVDVGKWADHTGTLVLFIATKCPISNAYNTRMAQLADTYTAKGIRVVAVNSNSAEPPAEMAEHAKKHKFSFPVLKDTGNVIADRFDAKVTPEAYLIDAKGVLRYHGRIDDSRDEGGVKSRDLQAALDALLAGKAIPVKETVAFGCSIKRV